MKQFDQPKPIRIEQGGILITPIFKQFNKFDDDCKSIGTTKLITINSITQKTQQSQQTQAQSIVKMQTLGQMFENQSQNEKIEQEESNEIELQTGIEDARNKQQLKVVLIIMSKTISLKLLKEQKLLTQYDNLYTSGQLQTLIFELIIIIPHPNLAFQGLEISIIQPYNNVNVIHKLNDLLSVIILFRVYLIFKVLLKQTVYANTRANRICRLYGCEGGYFYAAKCLMSEFPLTCVFILFIISLFTLGHALRVCEEQNNFYIEENSMDFGYYWQCWWCLIITMATIGYGDFYPRTIPGRAVIFIAAVWGCFLSSLLVVGLINYLKMEQAESRSHLIIKRLYERAQMKQEASLMITGQSKIYVNKQKENNVIMLSQLVQKFKSHIEQFNFLKRKISGMFEDENLNEEMTKQFDFLKEELKQIFQNQILLRDYLLQLKANGTLTEEHPDESSTNIFKELENTLGAN